LSDESVEGMRKKRGCLWWFGAFALFAIIFGDSDNDQQCVVGDKAFERAIQRAVGQWKVGDFALFATNYTSTTTNQTGVVQFSASVAAENGWQGNALGSVRLRKCRATVDQVE
jgi:hypothetical protein